MLRINISIEESKNSRSNKIDNICYDNDGDSIHVNNDWNNDNHNDRSNVHDNNDCNNDNHNDRSNIHDNNDCNNNNDDDYSNNDHNNKDRKSVV